MHLSAMVGNGPHTSTLSPRALLSSSSPLSDQFLATVNEHLLYVRILSCAYRKRNERRIGGYYYLDFFAAEETELGETE